jgi:hypothetical protein
VKKILACLTLVFVLVPTTALAHHREYETDELKLTVEGFCDKSHAYEGQTGLGGLAKMEVLDYQDDSSDDIYRMTLEWRLSRRLTHTKPLPPWEVWDSASVLTNHDVLPSGYGPSGGYADANWKLQLVTLWYESGPDWPVARHRMIVAKLDYRGVCEARKA